MSSYLNRVSIVGDVLPGFRLSSVKNGGQMLAFRVLTKRNWKDAQGERQEASETHHVTIFGTFAEYAHRNMIEGGKVMVEGEAETLSWLSEETGQQMTRQHVRCRTLLFL